MNRRQFIEAAAVTLLGASTRAARAAADTEKPRGRQVMTVAGPIDASALGLTLPHEHLLVDFIGADRASTDRYDRDEVVRVVLPHLEQAQKLGCRTLVDCTPAYLGRDPILLQRLSRASGLHILTTTGYYGAGDGFKFLPEHAKIETVEQLAERWISEFQRGIDGSGVRPGLIKIGVNTAPLHELHEKLVRAAARTHRRTGLTIASHTGDGRAALDQLDILRDEGVDPVAFIYVHAQNERDPALHAQTARSGAWLSYDGVAPNTIDRHLNLLRAAKKRGFLSQVLVSHDAGWYRPGEPNGGDFRPFNALFSQFLPALRNEGFTESDTHHLIVGNPAKALALRRRQIDP